MAGKGAVLVLERETLVARDLAELLTAEGYEVPACARSTGEAWTLAQRHRPDLALLDVDLEDDDGLATARRLREELGVPVLLLSARVAEATIEAAGAPEPLALVVKPFRARELLAALGATLQRGRLEHRLSHLNAVLRAIRSVNRLIVHETDRKRLLASACRVLVTTRSYEWAWVAEVDREGHPTSFTDANANPRARSVDDLREMVSSRRLPERARQALASPSPIVVREPWEDGARATVGEPHASTGGLIARLAHGGKKRGVLYVALALDLLDDLEEQALFQELADDLAYALGGIEQRAARQRAEEALERSRDELRELAMHLQVIADEERKAAAREIHDELGQLLTAISLDVSSAKRTLATGVGEPRAHLDRMGDLVSDALRVARRVAMDLRPVLLDELGLCAALRWQVGEMEKRLGIRCKLVVPDQEPVVSEAQALGIFRICQEALTNVARHARATRVTVRLAMTSRRVEISVKDNGVGLVESSTPRVSHGLLGMRERVRSLGGDLTIDGHAGRGTRVTARIPLTREEHHDTRPRGR